MAKRAAATKAKLQLHINWDTVRYTIILLAWVAVAMTLSQYIIGLPLGWVLGERFNQPLWVCVYYGLTYLLSLTLIVYLPPKVIHRLQTSRTEIGLNGLPSVVDVLLAPIAYVAYLGLSYIFTSIMSVFAWFDAAETQDVGFGYFITAGDRVVAIIALVFIAPIAEEIIMRGWLYGKLREKLKLPLAMLLVSLLFAVLHGQWNVSVGVFALSIVLCGLREITGTIWSGMLLHMLSNGIAFYLVYIAF